MGALSFPRPARNYWKTTPNAKRVFIQYFDPQLFVITMGTGIMAVLMHQNGYQFRRLQQISTVAFILQLVLLTMFIPLFLLRLTLHFTSTLTTLTSSLEDATHLSALSVSFSVMVTLISMIPGSVWNNWDYVAFSLWWIAVALCLVVAGSTYMCLFKGLQDMELEELLPTLMLPTTALLATATAGSSVVNFTGLSASLSMPVLIVSYMLLGAGLILTISTQSSLFMRLIRCKLPPPEKVAAQFLPVAPFSNAAYTFVTLGYLFGPKRNIMTMYGQGPLAQSDVANGLYSVGFVLGITIWGFATIWLLLTIPTFLTLSRKASFNPTYFALTYPLGVYGLAASQFAIDLDSRAFRVISSIVLVVLVIYWLWCIVYSVPLILSGEVFLKDGWEAEKEKERKREEEDVGGRGDPSEGSQ